MASSGHIFVQSLQFMQSLSCTKLKPSLIDFLVVAVLGMASTGQCIAHFSQRMHFSRSTSIEPLLRVIAPFGHISEQIPQDVQSSVTLPSHSTVFKVLALLTSQDCTHFPQDTQKPFIRRSGSSESLMVPTGHTSRQSIVVQSSHSVGSYRSFPSITRSAPCVQASAHSPQFRHDTIDPLFSSPSSCFLILILKSSMYIALFGHSEIHL